MSGIVAILCLGAAPIAAVGKSVALISDDDGCPLFRGAGFQCVNFPATGPDASLDPFDVVIVFSSEWTDGGGLLADVMRSGRGVVTIGSTPGALGINKNATVQAWMGANEWTLSGSDALLTTTTDPILGARPPGTELTNCFDALCSALSDTAGHPDAKVLATFGHVGSESIGILRNRWEGGQSVYFTEEALVGASDMLLNAARELAGPPDPAVPAVSQWGLVVLSLLVLTAGSIVLSRRLRTAT